MTNIYTDKKFLNSKFRKMIFPILLDIHFLKSENALKHFSIVNEIENADIVIVPIAINYFYKEGNLKFLNQFIDSALTRKKIVWVYAAGDYGITFRNDVQVFRLGGFKSKLKKNEHIMPSFVSDPYQYVLENEWKVVNKQEYPTVGFVGHANDSLINLTKEVLIYLKISIKKVFDKSIGDFQSFYPSGFYRNKILKRVLNSNQVNSNFILRKKYRAGAKTKEEKDKSTYEFFKNIENNLYTICIRGGGNFSVRLYETLIMGRIPIIIESDASLPLEGKIDWNSFTVITNSDNLIKNILLFHSSHSNEMLIEIQNKNRNLMIKSLNRIDYFLNFI